MEIVGLKELGPELRLGHLRWNVLHMFSLHSRICLENAFDYVGRQVVLQAIASVCLGFNISQKSTGHT
jgi:hypothetical protein